MEHSGPPVIRPARAEDLPRLVELSRRSWLSAFAQTAPYELIAWWVSVDRAKGLCEQGWPRMLVGVAGGEIVGLVQPETDEINGLWVHPRHQGRGHGRALLQAAEAAIRAAGHPGAWLTCSGFNERAIAFYVAAGYVEAGRTAVPLPCGGEGVNVRMERRFGGAV